MVSSAFRLPLMIADFLWWPRFRLPFLSQLALLYITKNIRTRRKTTNRLRAIETIKSEQGAVCADTSQDNESPAGGLDESGLITL